MELRVLQNSQEIGTEIAKKVINLVKVNQKAVLGLATGSSPLPTYESIIKSAKQEYVSFKKVTCFNLDEYVGLNDMSKSYRFFMNENLFDHIDINKNNTFFPSTQNYLEYDELIASKGGIDLQILGIGNNGHIAFNEPGCSFNSKTHIEELTKSTRDANTRFFNSLEEVPTHAITMGLSTIMQANEIVIIITGSAKKEALSMLLSGKITTDFPASVLNNHKNVCVFVDQELYNSVK